MGTTRARRRGRLVAPVLGCGLLLTALAPGAAVGADEESEPDTASGLVGERIEPGTSLQDTTVVTSGSYVLPVPEENAPHYFEVERTEPGEVVWYGVTAVTSTPLTDATLSVTGTAEGDETAVCNGLAGGPSEEGYVVSELHNANRSGDCADAESITLEVVNLGVFGDALPAGEDDYQLTVWTEPPVERTDTLPGANENPPYDDGSFRDLEPQPIEGGASFAEAPAVEDGLYETTIRKGEPRFLAFPLTWGQHAQVSVRVEEPVVDEAFEQLSPIWLTPLGGQVRTVTPLQSPVPIEAGIAGNEAVWATPIVTYQNRRRVGTVGFSGTGSADGSAAAPAAFAGTYVLVLDVPADDGVVEFPDEITLRLGATTVTDYEGSVPDYATEPSVLPALDGSGFAATEAQRRRQELAAAREAAAPPPWPLAVGLLGLAAVLAVVGGLAVGRVVGGRR